MDAVCEQVTALLGTTAKAIQCRMVGSTFIFGNGKDVDILCRVCEDTPKGATNQPYTLNRLSLFLESQGWDVSYGASYPADDGWFSARYGAVNLLFTVDAQFYGAMAKGADVCKALAEHGVLTKDDKRARIIIHRTLTGEAL